MHSKDMSPATTRMRRISLVAFCLMGIAVALPFIALALGGMTAHAVGYLFGRTLLPGMLVLVVLMAVLGRATQNVKAWGRLAVGVVMVVGMGAVCVNAWWDTHRLANAKDELVEELLRGAASVDRAAAPQIATQSVLPDAATVNETASVSGQPVGASETDRNVAFVKGVQTIVARWASQATDLQRQFAAVDLSNVLKPETLTSRAGLNESRASINRVESLIHERNIALQRHFSESMAYIKSADISEAERRVAIAIVEADRHSVQAMYQELGKVQLASLSAISAMINFAEANLGIAAAQNGQILFQSQAQLDDYQLIMASIQEATAKEEVVTRKAMEMQQESRQSMLTEFGKP